MSTTAEYVYNAPDEMPVEEQQRRAELAGSNLIELGMDRDLDWQEGDTDVASVRPSG